jgi:Lar family restriction alleviation protein
MTLKPCPFCGFGAKVVSRPVQHATIVHAVCLKCGAAGPLHVCNSMFDWYTEQSLRGEADRQAADAWNKRSV